MYRLGKIGVHTLHQLGHRYSVTLLKNNIPTGNVNPLYIGFISQIGKSQTFFCSQRTRNLLQEISPTMWLLLWALCFLKQGNISFSCNVSFGAEPFKHQNNDVELLLYHYSLAICQNYQSLDTG